MFLSNLASIGLGIAFIPDFCFRPQIQENLYIVKTKEQIPTRKLVAAYDTSFPLTQPAQYFLNLMLDSNK